LGDPCKFEGESLFFSCDLICAGLNPGIIPGKATAPFGNVLKMPVLD